MLSHQGSQLIDELQQLREQIARLADAVERIAERMDDWTAIDIQKKPALRTYENRR